MPNQSNNKFGRGHGLDVARKETLRQTLDRERLRLAAGQELLRQQHEIFHHNLLQDCRWNRLRRSMGWCSIVVLFGICFLCAYVLFKKSEFEPTTIKYAVGALFVDTIGLVVMVWKVTFGSKFVHKLSPTVDIRDILGEEAELRPNSPEADVTKSTVETGKERE